MYARRSPRPAALAGLALALVASACSNDPAPAGAGSRADTGPAVAAHGASDADVARAIRDLVTAVTPLPAEAPVGVQSDWFPNRRATLQRLRAAGPVIGRAALAEYHERDRDLDDIRAGLLDVAAH
ncbi:MAG: hypothetical protein WD226_04290, partial [Planctomycetota bacterium]